MTEIETPSNIDANIPDSNLVANPPEYLAALEKANNSLPDFLDNSESVNETKWQELTVKPTPAEFYAARREAAKNAGLE